MRELRVHMDFYMEMKEDETEEDAKDRFYKEFSTENMSSESSITIYGFEVCKLKHKSRIRSFKIFTTS